MYLNLTRKKYHPDLATKFYSIYILYTNKYTTLIYAHFTQFKQHCFSSFFACVKRIESVAGANIRGIPFIASEPISVNRSSTYIPEYADETKLALKPHSSCAAFNRCKIFSRSFGCSKSALLPTKTTGTDVPSCKNTFLSISSFHFLASIKDCSKLPSKKLVRNDANPKKRSTLR
jgi:hypothetical protein